MDRIGLVVTSLVEGSEGFLRVSAVGGVDRRMLAGCPVTVHAKGGSVPGVVATLPPHLQEGEQKNPKIDDILIDTGMAAKDAKARIAPGDPITFDGPLLELLGEQVACGGLDDRSGCAAVIMAAQMLAEQAAWDVYVVLASMEEVGGTGAATAAYTVNPQAAIAVDVSFGNTPGTPAHKCGKMGGGPMIGIAPVLSRTLGEELAEMAERTQIPCQYEVMGGATHTDADGIAACRAGVATALLSIPTRNMHTPVEMARLSDIEATAQLMAAFAKEGI